MGLADKQYINTHFFPIKSTVCSGHYPPPILNNHFTGNVAGTLLHCQATNLERRRTAASVNTSKARDLKQIVECVVLQKWLTRL